MVKSLYSGIEFLGFELWLRSYFLDELFLSFGPQFPHLNSSAYFLGIWLGLVASVCAKFVKQGLDPKSSTHISYCYYYYLP